MARGYCGASTTPVSAFTNDGHRAAGEFLQLAVSSGKLGSGPSEPEPSAKYTVLAVFRTIPWVATCSQLLWSSAVTTIAYFVGVSATGLDNSLDLELWKSRMHVLPFVTSSVGWALFVLLALFITEASRRYHDALASLYKVGIRLQFALRNIRQNYPEGTWHPGAMERIAAHIIAYPIALKMTLRKDRSPEQLQPLLHPLDVDDIINADIMHVHCLRVVRSYLMVAEEDSIDFHLSDTDQTPTAHAMRRNFPIWFDAIDTSASSALSIAEFRPALAYINHLAILLIIWNLFVPLSMVDTSGWYVSLPHFLKYPKNRKLKRKHIIYFLNYTFSF